jgi:hypothetical protein
MVPARHEMGISVGVIPVKCIAVLTFLLVFAVVRARPLFGSQPSDTLLPPTTKGYLSIPDVDAFESSFQATQIGKLLDDPLMKPFFEDIREQIESRVVRSDNPLTIRLEDLGRSAAARSVWR